MMINKNRFRVSNDKKVLHKIGKRWVTVSALTLALLGGVAAASTVTTHAASVQSASTEKVAEKPAQSATPKNIMSAASNMHQGMLATAPKSVAPSASASTKPSSASQSASSVSSRRASSAVSSVAGSSVASSGSVNNSSASFVNNKASGNQTISSSSVSTKSSIASNSNNISSEMSYLNSLSNVEYSAEVASLKGSSANKPSEIVNKVAKSKLGTTPQTNPFSGKYTTGNLYGMNYKDYTDNKALEFTNGQATKLDWLYRVLPHQDTEYIKFDNIDASKVTAMNSMFQNDTSLKTIDLSGLHNTGNAQTMSALFASDSNLQSVKLPSNFDAHNTTDMSDMFHNDSKLTDLHMPSQFNATNVNNMYAMFQNTGLTSIDLSGLQTSSKLNDTSWMFSGSNFNNLTLPSTFNTSKVTTMKGMFGWDSNLQHINLPNNFNTFNVNDMSYMFDYDKHLQSVPISNFNTSNVTDMSWMFNNDFALKTLNLPDTFNTSKVTNMEAMFALCDNLESLTLPSCFDTSNVRDMQSMLLGLHSATKLALGPNFDTHNATNMAQMFSDEWDLPTINFGNKFYTNNVTNMMHMFDSDYSLQNLTLPNTFDTNNVNNMYMMFIRDGINLPKGHGTDIKLDSGFTTSNAINNNNASDGAQHNNNNGLQDMFQYTNLNSLTVPQGTNFQLNSKTQLKPLYLKDANDNATESTAHDFTKGNNIGVFTNKANTYQYSDIYSNIDGMTAPKSVVSTKVPNAPINWQFVNEVGKVSNTPMVRNGKTLVAPSYRGMTYKYNKKDKSVEFVSGTANNSLNSFSTNANANIKGAKSIKFDSDINTHNISDMSYMFHNDHNLTSLTLPSNLDLTNVKSMFGALQLTGLTNINLSGVKTSNKLENIAWLFSGDNMNNITLPSTFDTSKVSDMSGMFSWSSLQNLTLPNDFTTANVKYMSDMFAQSNSIKSITMPSTAKFNVQSQLGRSWYPVEKGTDYTVPNAKATNLMDSGSHAGTWVKNPNVQQVSDTVAFYNKVNDTLVGRPFTAKGADGSTYTVKEAPQGWHFVNNDNSFTLEPSMTSNVKIMVDGKPMNNQPNHDIPVAPTIVNGVITYKYNNKQAGNSINTKGRIGTSAKATVDGNVPSGYQLAGNSDSFNFWSDGGKTNAININLKALSASATVDYQYNNSTKGSHKFTGNDSRAILASDTSANVTASNEPGMPAGYQLSNNANNVPFDNKAHDVAIKPIQQTDNIQFMNNGHQVGTTTTKGNDSRTGINGSSTAALPTGYQLAKGASASVANDGKTHQINVTPIQQTDIIDYQLNGVTKGNHQFTGNDVQANGATGTSFDVDSSNDAGMPQGYQLVDKDNRFNYDGGTHNVAIEATNQTANVNYNLPDGTNISSGTISGDVNTSTKPTQAPQGYHFAGNVTPYSFTPANAGNNPSDNVTVAPNTVKGTATIHINYNVSGHTYNGSNQHVSINGQYGQPDKVVYPVSYQPTNDDYSTTSQPLDINFNDVAKNGSNDSYNPSATFTYDATEAPDLVIRYDDTTNHNNVVHSDTFTPAQLGVKPQDWVVGNAFTFGTKGTKNAIDVIEAPYGYHLVNNAKGFDYQNGTETITLEPTQINTSTGTKRVILMAMPMFFHHSQPNKPVTPSSASAKPSSAASSAAPSSANASVAPSSASQSTSSSTPARQIIDHGSIEPKGNTPESVNTPTSTPSNKPSDVTPANQPSDVAPVVHKHTTKSSVQKDTQPSDQIVNKNAGKTKAESKPLVEPSRHVAKVQHEAQNHMTNLSNKMAQPTVHAANVHAYRIDNAKRSANVRHKLPQTNEAKAAGLMGAASIMAALGLAGADADRKRRRE